MMRVHFPFIVPFGTFLPAFLVYTSLGKIFKTVEEITLVRA